MTVNKILLNYKFHNKNFKLKKKIQKKIIKRMNLILKIKKITYGKSQVQNKKMILKKVKFQKKIGKKIFLLYLLKKFLMKKIHLLIVQQAGIKE